MSLVSLTSIGLGGVTLAAGVSALVAIGYILSAVVAVFLGFGVFILFNNISRLTRIKCGKRLKPDGKKAILITGATSGIGLLIAKHFYKLGFTVIAGYYNDQEPGYAELLAIAVSTRRKKGLKNGEAECESGRSSRSQLCLVRMDVRSRDSIERAAGEVNEYLDAHNMELHALVNNAGISHCGPLEWSSRDSIEAVIGTNLAGTALVTREFLFRIIKCKGRVINTSSGLHLLPAAGISMYVSTKCAVTYFSDSLHADLEPYGASCHCILPGNFIRSTNIVFTTLRFIQESEKGLSADEKSMYQSSIDRYRAVQYSMIASKLRTSSVEQLKQLAAVHKVEIPESILSNNVEPKRSLFTRLHKWFVSRIDGGAVQNLEDSGLLDSYVHAVLLEQPPRHLYAGTCMYTWITGPSMEFLPPIWHKIMGNFVVGSFYS